MSQVYDLVGIGIGPFNLSLAALLAGKEKNIKFLDNKKKFAWHPELMFGDAQMQTSYLKDLVTAVDPTSPYSFLNYLVKNGQFYQFLNTERKAISRIEFECYMSWVASQLESLEFDSMVDGVEYKDGAFHIHSRNSVYFSKSLSVASGPVKNIPDCAKEFLGENIFHAKSPLLKDIDFAGKRVLIVGGGQTGLEIFRNGLKEKWSRAESLTLITARDNLSPLDEGPFTNEIFTPEFVSNFYTLDQETKDDFTQRLLLASDGNTPDYLQDFYNELYMDKYYTKSFTKHEILPKRWLQDISKNEIGYTVALKNLLSEESEKSDYDIVILATGFKTELPRFLSDLAPVIKRDNKDRLLIDRDYKLQTDLEAPIYMMNFSRHGHGVADPQTSLMSWRSAVIANSILGKETYQVNQIQNGFLNYFKHEER